LRVLIKSIFSQPEWPVNMQNNVNNCPPLLNWGLFCTCLPSLSQKPLHARRKWVLLLTFCVVGPYTLPFNYWHRPAISKGKVWIAVSFTLEEVVCWTRKVTFWWTIIDDTKRPSGWLEVLDLDICIIVTYFNWI